MPSMAIVLGSELSCSHVRLDSGAPAGPCRTVPSRWNREPWHGQSKVLSVSLSAIEQPRWEQLMASTCTLPCWSLTAKPPKARSPAIVAATVGHDEGRVPVLRSVELDSVTV